MVDEKSPIALVTGASRGIGKAIATELASRDLMVVGTATTSKGASKISSYLENMRIPGVGMAVDVADDRSVEKLLTEINEKFGSPTVLINNAGITRDNLLMRMKLDEWHSVIDTNLNSMFRVTKLCLKGMTKARSGRIINISSVVSASGNPGQTNYAASKAGIVQLTKALALEWARYKIRVNALCPGYIETPLNKAFLESDAGQALVHRIPQRRLGQLSDLDAPLLLIASDASAYMTGSVLVVDGGHLVSSL